MEAPARRGKSVRCCSLPSIPGSQVTFSGDFEPLPGYLALEGAGVVVDMVGHRLVALKVFDLKSTRAA